MTTTPPISMTPYVKQFALVLLFCTVILVLVQMFLVELPSAMGIITIMAAGGVPIQKFAADHQREMQKSERVSFATLGSVLAIVLSAAFFLLAIFLTGGLAGLGLGDMPLWFLPLMFVISFVISWLVLYFETGFMVKMALKNLAKQKK
jgi:hypothetical protein